MRVVPIHFILHMHDATLPRASAQVCIQCIKRMILRIHDIYMIMVYVCGCVLYHGIIYTYIYMCVLELYVLCHIRIMHLIYTYISYIRMY